MKRNRLLRLCLLAALLLAMLSAPALAKVVSAGADFYYLDSANVLPEALEGEIFFSNRLLDSACGAQVVVVTLDTTGSEAIGDYAYELFNKWGIGDSKRNNGFLLLLAIGDEDYYALCGTGLQSSFSAGTLKTYYDQYLEDDFAAGNYEAGVKRFFEAVFDRVAGTYQANVTVQQGIAAYERHIASGDASDGFGGYSGAQSGGKGSNVLKYLLLLAIVLFILSRLRRRRPYAGHVVSNGGGSGRWKNLLGIYLISRLFRRRPQNTGNVWQHAHTYRPRSASRFGPTGPFSGRPGHTGPFGGRSGSSFRPSSGARRSAGFGGARGGGGRTSGGGAGRGRH